MSPKQAPSGRAREELRVYGLNACLAVHARRPQAIRKVWLTEARLPQLRAVLADCARARIGYNVVATGDLDRLTQSAHHEGVCFDVLRPESRGLAALLDHARTRPDCLVIWLDGIGNPHNYGAVLRTAAHFDAVVVQPRARAQALSGAACRVAEGGAEATAQFIVDDPASAIKELRVAGFAILATRVRDAQPVYDMELPGRAVLLFGNEATGLDAAQLAQADAHVMLPGSGAVESLNVATAVGIFAAEFRRRHRSGA